MGHRREAGRFRRFSCLCDNCYKSKSSDMPTPRAVLFALLSLPLAAAAEGGDADLVKHLPDAKLSLADGIKQAEKGNGTAISAKFELEDGKLSLSVYTAKEGREKDAEHNTLMELAGEPGAQWQPKTEVFGDKEHLTRSAMHLTLIQLTKLSLEDVIKKAAAAQKGTVYSAIPGLKDGKPVVAVQIAAADGKAVTVNVDLLTGKAAK